MNQLKNEYDKIQVQHTELESAALRSAQLKAELVASERKLAEARRDDGTTPPEEIYARVESATREVEIIRIQANRAAAATSKEEDNYATMIRKIAPSLAEYLENLSRTEAQKIAQEAVAVFKQDVSAMLPFKQLVAAVAVVHDPETTAKRIRTCINIYREISHTPQDYITNVLSAGRFLGSQED